MPTGFVYTTSHVTDIPIGYLSPEAVVLVGIDVVTRLGWQIVSFSNGALLAQVDNEEILVVADLERVLIKSMTADDRAHDWGKNRKNVVAFEKLFHDLRKEIDDFTVPEAFEAFVNQHHDKYDVTTANNQKFWLKEKSGKGSLFRKGFVVTPLLIIINFLVFILMVLTGADIVDPTSKHIFRWGGNFVPATLESQWWRIFTSQFVHVGIIHLLTNMVALLFVGMTLEPLFGKSRFVIAYLLSGVGGALLSMSLKPDNLSAGASGCIFGLFGIFLALLSVNLTDRENRKRLFPVLAIYIGYLLAGGMKEQHIDVSAHAGGLISGLLLGYAFLPSLNRFDDKQLKYKTLAGVGMAALIVLLLFFGAAG